MKQHIDPDTLKRFLGDWNYAMRHGSRTEFLDVLWEARREWQRSLNNRTMAQMGSADVLAGDVSKILGIDPDECLAAIESLAFGSMVTAVVKAAAGYRKQLEQNHERRIAEGYEARPARRYAS